MTREGPPLATLLRRIVDTPPDFLAEPKVGDQGVVHVDAVAGDVVALLGAPVPRGLLTCFVTTVSTTVSTTHSTTVSTTDRGERNRLSIALLACWICADPWLRVASVKAEELLRALDTVSSDLAPYAPAKSFHTDPERREELARTMLARLDLRPEGEREAQARDRLLSVSAAERKRLVEATRGAVERVRAIREALARKAAEESADKMWRE